MLAPCYRAPWHVWAVVLVVLVALAALPGNADEAGGAADWRAPRITVMPGCSMSTAMQHLLRSVLRRLAGSSSTRAQMSIHLPAKVKPEATKAKNNAYLARDGDPLGPAMQKLHQRTIAENRTLVFKAYAKDFSDPTFVEWVVRSGARLVCLHRSNVLDRRVCSVRDCFLKGAAALKSYAVDVDTGKKSELCMDRRKAELGGRKVSPVQAKLDTESLLEVLEHMQNSSAAEASFLQTRLRKAGAAELAAGLRVISTEELLEFEFDGEAEAMERSMDAWAALLESLGVAGPAKAVARELEPMHGVRQLKRHADTIFNIDEVKERLHGTEYERMLRL